MTSFKELLEKFKNFEEVIVALEVIQKKSVDIPDLIKCFEVDGKRVEYNMNHVNHLSRKEFNLLKKFWIEANKEEV